MDRETESKLRITEKKDLVSRINLDNKSRGMKFSHLSLQINDRNPAMWGWSEGWGRGLAAVWPDICNKKYLILLKCCPKSSQGSYYLKSATYISASFVRNIVSKTFQNGLIWSHWLSTTKQAWLWEWVSEYGGWKRERGKVWKRVFVKMGETV